MKLNKKQLRLYILSEVKKLGQAEGWLPKDEIVENNINESTEVVISESSTKETTILNEQTVVNLPIVDNNSDTPTSAPIEKVTISDVKKLNEEFKRMKLLVDFRSPLFD